MSTVPQLTSTTAPGKIFSSRSELAEHYKSDWHKYNLKRREAGMNMLTFDEFSARLEAAMTLRKERDERALRGGMDHLKDKNAAVQKKTTSSGGQKQRISKRKQRQQERMNGNSNMLSPANEETMEEEKEENEQEEETMEDMEEEAPEIDPLQSLFDNHTSSSIEENIKYMYEKYGFFVPDKEFLIDSEGLIGYCAEKVKLGHICLYCQHIFTTWQGCQKHMVDTRHTKLRYEVGVDLDEFDVFYDFTEDDKEFLDFGLGSHKRRKKKTDIGEVGKSLDEMVISEDDAEDDEEWEDINSDEEMEEDVKDGLYAAYEDELARHGFDITPLGELIFPSGKIIGHRGLAKYYRQRFAPEDARASVAAAKKASGEHLFNGRVYDIYSQDRDQKKDNSSTSIISLAKAGLSMAAAKGRSGKGILVSTSGALNGASSFTALSLYRYKAAVKKSRREEFKARRLVERTSQPMNKMDKKGNRMITGVSVAHAPR